MTRLGEAGDHGVPRHDVPRGHPVEHGARGGEVLGAEERGEARVGRDEDGEAVARRGLVEQVVVVRWGQEAEVEVRERGVRVGVGEEAEAEEVRMEEAAAGSCAWAGRRGTDLSTAASAKGQGRWPGARRRRGRA